MTLAGYTVPTSYKYCSTKMKILTFIPFACFLVTSLAAAEPSKDENISENIEFKTSERIIEEMKDQGWSVEGLTTTELGSMTVFHRNGKMVGYCVVESEWRPISPEKLPLSGVTKIAYGDPAVPPAGAIWFTIEDPAEISLWVAAYRNHSRSSHKMLRFVALGADAGFQNTDIEIKYGTGHGCHTGLYFYNGDKEVRVSGRHWDQASETGKPSPNEILQALVWDRIRKEQAKRQPQKSEEANPSGPSPVPNSTQPHVEQAADGKTPEAPQPPH